MTRTWGTMLLLAGVSGCVSAADSAAGVGQTASACPKEAPAALAQQADGPPRLESTARGRAPQSFDSSEPKEAPPAKAPPKAAPAGALATDAAAPPPPPADDDAAPPPGKDASGLRQVGYTSSPDAPEAVVPATTAPGAPAAAPAPKAPLVRLVNSKRITLNFEVKGVGPSGLSTVELWYTQDCKDWKKYDAPTQAQSYVLDVDGEGMYGFTLVAKSGVGLGKEPPAPGDQPQMWVSVDLTAPAVQLEKVTQTAQGKQQVLAVSWKAADKNLGGQPITLSYAEGEAGPWKPIAANLPNTGRYEWHLPAGHPASVHVRVEAADLAGNVGHDQTKGAVVIDSSTPTASILTVEAGKK